MQCSVSAGVSLNVTACIIYDFGVAAGDICGFQRRAPKTSQQRSSLVGPPEGQAPRKFEHKKEGDWGSLLHMVRRFAGAVRYVELI